MAEGRSNAGIAARLYLSPKSVERNVAAVAAVAAVALFRWRG